MEFDEDDFLQAKERQAREYQNNLLDMPLKQSFDYMKGALIEGYVTYPQKKQALQNVSWNDLRTFQKQFFQKTYIQGMITGSITQDQAKELTDLTVRRLQQGSQAQAKPYFPVVRSLQNCNGPCMVSFNTHAQGNALLLVLGAEGYSAEQRNLQQILSLSTWEAFFTELRTKQQTGYMVASDAVDLYNHLFSYFSVQSSKYLPEELLWRFERFLESYVNDLEEQEVTLERFNSLKTGLKTKLIEPPGSFSLFGELLFKLGFEVKDFQWLNQRISNLDQITYDQFILFTKQFLGRENHRRLALMIVDKNAKDAFNYSMIDSLNALRKTPLVVDKQTKSYGKQKSL
jgi:insulysin